MLKNIKIIQTKSSIGRIPRHKATLSGLGLKYIGHKINREDSPSVRGMINLISYMVKIEE